MKQHAHRISTCILAIGLLFGSCAAYAAEDSFVVASVDGGRGERFLPLKPVRDGVVRVDNGLKRAPLRSDMQATRDGFMRIDRTLLKPQHHYRSARVTDPAARVEQESGVRVVRPQPRVLKHTAARVAPDDAAITDLFAAAPASTNFRDALSGRRAIGGKQRHAWPLPLTAKQEFTSGYGMRKDPFHGRQTFHGGIDIAAAVGTPVLASADGVVSKVENTRGLGKFVAVQHRDGTESYYGHLSAQSVRVGQRVMQGQKIGALGSTGRSTGPHLDYRIKKNGQGFNPMAVLQTPRAVVASR